VFSREGCTHLSLESIARGGAREAPAIQANEKVGTRPSPYQLQLPVRAIPPEQLFELRDVLRE
jgi:hypothetical protein